MFSQQQPVASLSGSAESGAVSPSYSSTSSQNGSYFSPPYATGRGPELSAAHTITTPEFGETVSNSSVAAAAGLRQKRGLGLMGQLDECPTSQQSKRLRAWDYSPFPFANSEDVSHFLSDSARVLYEYNLAFFTAKSRERRPAGSSRAAAVPAAPCPTEIIEHPRSSSFLSCPQNRTAPSSLQDYGQRSRRCSSSSNCSKTATLASSSSACRCDLERLPQSHRECSNQGWYLNHGCFAGAATAAVSPPLDCTYHPSAFRDHCSHLRHQQQTQHHNLYPHRVCESHRNNVCSLSAEGTMCVGT